MTDSYELYEPCPECGATDLIHTIIQSEDVILTDDGYIDRFEPRSSLAPDVLEVICPECDDTIWTKDE